MRAESNDRYSIPDAQIMEAIDIAVSAHGMSADEVATALAVFFEPEFQAAMRLVAGVYKIIAEGLEAAE